ncbi:mechanosensitive ion channel family protein [Candidatus Saccharibacteria bacterium]|nr:mechanosensitive ion channel family protein [Candidatus Saccharibacteria bacterium]
MFATIDNTIEHSQSTFETVINNIFNFRSLFVLIIAVGFAYFAGRFLATILRRLTKTISKQADRSTSLQRVNSLRRIETLIVLSIAVLRTLLIAFAIYFWWIFVHPTQQPTAIIGASAVVAIVLAGALSPLLRDLASGSVMMAEHWFGVGDHIRVEPFADLQGVVERVTLRSTRVRGLNGEVIWINNQSIQAVRISPKGIRTMAIELFVTDLEKGKQLVERANLRLPSGPLMVVSPLTTMKTTEAGQNIWHLTAIGETAPGREWLLEHYAITLLKDVDEQENKTSILLNDPIARYADSEAEREFARTIHNARKQPAQRRKLSQMAIERSKRKANNG